MIVKDYINEYVSSIYRVLHDARMEAGSTAKNQYKSKAHWCPELSALMNGNK